MCNGEGDQFHEVVLNVETLVFSPLRPLQKFKAALLFVKLVSQRQFEKVPRNRLRYTVQLLLKLVLQRRCTQLSAKSFNVYRRLQLFFRVRGDKVITGTVECLKRKCIDVTVIPSPVFSLSRCIPLEVKFNVSVYASNADKKI